MGLEGQGHTAPPTPAPSHPFSYLKVTYKGKRVAAFWNMWQQLKIRLGAKPGWLFQVHDWVGYCCAVFEGKDQRVKISS